MRLKRVRKVTGFTKIVVCRCAKSMPFLGPEKALIRPLTNVTSINVSPSSILCTYRSSGRFIIPTGFFFLLQLLLNPGEQYVGWVPRLPCNFWGRRLRDIRRQRSAPAEPGIRGGCAGVPGDPEPAQ